MSELALAAQQQNSILSLSYVKVSKFITRVIPNLAHDTSHPCLKWWNVRTSLKCGSSNRKLEIRPSKNK